MNRQGTKIIAVLLISLTLASGRTVRTNSAELPVNSLSATSVSFDKDGREHNYLKSITDRSVWNYVRPTLSVSNKSISVKGVIINGVYYVPFRQTASAIQGSSYSYNSKTKTSTMRSPGLEIIASDGCYVTYANGRSLFSTTPNVIMNDGRMYIPATVFAKAVGMSLDVSEREINITGSYKPLVSAEKFYREDEVFWLARIIHAESRGESLLGQIAVGNVVLNRVDSNYYPNTIYGVIFDRKYGVQFSPVLDGTIYNTPGYTATLAAKICLEGYDVSEGAFFFLAPELATSSWIPRTREYAFTIGNHDFYK